MGKVTNGTVEYGETRRIAEYENKKATVTLSFTIDDGEDADDIISGISEACITRCHHMLGLKTGKMPKPEPAPAALEPAKPEPKAAPKRPPGRPKKAAPDPAEVTDEEDPAEEPAVEPEDEDLGDIMGEKAPEPELTDKVLIEAVQKKVGQIGKASLVRPVIEKHAGGKGKHVSMIPMLARPAFLAEIAGLSA